MNDALKVLVVDDTLTYRMILSNIVSGLEDVELVGTAVNGKLALAKIKESQPDLVFLDIIMPEMDGLEALGRIKKDFPGVDVIMVSGMSHESADITVKALEAGALDFISKPKGSLAEESAAILKAALTPLMLLAKSRKDSRQTTEPAHGANKTSLMSRAKTSFGFGTQPQKSREPATVVTPKARPAKAPGVIGKIDVIALGVSTGGPNALMDVIPKIRKDIPVPIIAVQHMPPVFTASLAQRLDKTSAITVVEGAEKQPVKAGFMYIAPGGRHMVVRKDNAGSVFLDMNDSPPVLSCRPAVDVLFRSIGMVYGGNVLTVILTGMGNDGASGVATIRRKGGYSIIQDEESSVVWGMPGAVVDANEADEIIPLDKMHERIMAIAFG